MTSIILLSDTSVTGRSLPSNSQSRLGLAGHGGVCCNSDWADAATGTCGGHTTGRRETDTGGRIRGHFADKLIDRTEPASPPRAGPCARAPLSPPVAPASFSAAADRAAAAGRGQVSGGRASARVGQQHV